jgi:hypothetical protein
MGMIRVPFSSSLVCLLLRTILVLPVWLFAQNSTSPASISHEAPEYPGFNKVRLEQRRAVGIGSGPSFATEIHVDLVENTPESLACTNILARAQWRQDILLALDAKAHFDNCQFQTTNEYLIELLMEAESAAKKNDRDQALAALGRALHAIQDFYSHTNYVELSERRFQKPDDIPIVPVWNDAGRSEIIKQAQNGLVSGNVWWEPGARCKAPARSHGELNKDTPASSSGKQMIQIWNETQHQVARDLARRATLEFLRTEFSKPELSKLGEQCKGRIGVMLMTDNRTNP